MMSYLSNMAGITTEASATNPMSDNMSDNLSICFLLGLVIRIWQDYTLSGLLYQAVSESP